MSLIAITASIPDLQPQAEAIAQKLNLPFTTQPYAFDYELRLTPKHLCLIKTGEKLLPLYVDFLSGKMTYRRQQASLRNEILARALGLTHRIHPKIVDATAGLARDSFILASLGFDIQLIERSSIVYALVQDGMRRAAENSHVAPIVNRLHLIQADAIAWLQTCMDPPDVIYLDPMFPERHKSALVKKEMRIFHEIIGEDLDAEQLLTAALSCASRRVVVKRPRLADPVKGPLPSLSMKGSSSRFDIYLIKDTHGNASSIT